MDYRPKQHKSRLWMGLEERTEPVPAQLPALHRLERDVAGSPRSAVLVDGLELANEVTGAQDCEHDFVAVDGVEGDLDPTAQQHEDSIAAVTLHDYGRAAPEAAWLSETEEIHLVGVGQLVEERARHRPREACRRHPLSLSPPKAADDAFPARHVWLCGGGGAAILRVPAEYR